jgi:hypothetical protein
LTQNGKDLSLPSRLKRRRAVPCLFSAFRLFPLLLIRWAMFDIVQLKRVSISSLLRIIQYIVLFLNPKQRIHRFPLRRASLTYHNLTHIAPCDLCLRSLPEACSPFLPFEERTYPDR